MELDPRLQKICLALLDFEGMPVVSKPIRIAIVGLLHSQAKCIMEKEIPVLTQVVEYGPRFSEPKRFKSDGDLDEKQTAS